MKKKLILLIAFSFIFIQSSVSVFASEKQGTISVNELLNTIKEAKKNYEAKSEDLVLYVSNAKDGGISYTVEPMLTNEPLSIFGIGRCKCLQDLDCKESPHGTIQCGFLGMCKKSCGVVTEIDVPEIIEP